MAFSKVLSGGLADDAVSGDNIAPSAYLENTTGQNLSGTISQNRMYTSDAYTLTGDLTVNDTVGLMSATGNSTNVTIMNDGSNRTITGSGTVEGGELYSSTNNLSGMIGELRSVVTGSPNLNLTTGTLGSGVTGGAGLGFVKVKMGNYQFQQGMSTGTQTITGVGFKGNYIEGWVNYTGSTSSTLKSYGYAKEIGGSIIQQCTQFVSDTSNSTLSHYIASTSDAASGTDSHMQKFYISSFDADGFTIKNVLTGGPSTVHGFTYIIYHLGDLVA